MRKVERSEFPVCDICKRETAMYDAPTMYGPWANMCADDFAGHAGSNANAIGYEFVLPGEKQRSEDTLAKEIRDAVNAGDFDLAGDLIGDRDFAEFL